MIMDGDARENRLRLSGDPHRPLYHFLPPCNWMNDPNGLIQWGGRYHLFYQHNPVSASWGIIHWGHAVSQDMFHWEDYPVALSPTPGSWDQSGCWSGSAVNYHHIPTLIYTARNGEEETVCLATSQDDLVTWQKHPRNPILVYPPKGVTLSGFRDPFVWQNGSGWNMIIGSGYPGKGGVVFLYNSNDLMRWELGGPLLEWENLDYGEMWECPNLLRFGEKYLLLVSVMGQSRVVYFIGDYQGGRFTLQQHGTFDAGGSFYAPLGFYDETGRAIVFGWVWEGRSRAAQLAAGWAGVQALPRQLSLEQNGGLKIEPIKEIETIRHNICDVGRVTVDADHEMVLPFSGNCLEICLAAAISKNSCGIRILCAPDGSEFTEIGYDCQNGTLYIDRRKSSLSPETIKELREAKIDLAKKERLELRIFVDRSIVEVFANKQWCLTSRVYPENNSSLNVCLFSKQGETTFSEVRCWQMERIWP